MRKRKERKGNRQMRKSNERKEINSLFLLFCSILEKYQQISTWNNKKNTSKHPEN